MSLRLTNSDLNRANLALFRACQFNQMGVIRCRKGVTEALWDQFEECYVFAGHHTFKIPDYPGFYHNTTCLKKRDLISLARHLKYRHSNCFIRLIYRIIECFKKCFCKQTDAQRVDAIIKMRSFDTTFQYYVVESSPLHDPQSLYDIKFAYSKELHPTLPVNYPAFYRKALYHYYDGKHPSALKREFFALKQEENGIYPSANPINEKFRLKLSQK
ncbi:MAG: hypothetical protein MRY21_07585 [Simkaniaceae bacterium]|nr:hypothetical protein [Simkaniaceae bacterium]